MLRPKNYTPGGVVQTGVRWVLVTINVFLTVAGEYILKNCSVYVSIHQPKTENIGMYKCKHIINTHTHTDTDTRRHTPVQIDAHQRAYKVIQVQTQADILSSDEVSLWNEAGRHVWD